MSDDKIPPTHWTVEEPWDFDYLDRSVPTYVTLGQHRYFWLSRDEVLARLRDGWMPQVWQPRSQQWTDYSDLDWMHEGVEIDEAKAKEMM